MPLKLSVNICKSYDFPFQRLRSKVVGVACESAVVGVSCRLLRFVYITSLSLTYERGGNGTATSDGSWEPHWLSQPTISFDILIL